MAKKIIKNRYTPALGIMGILIVVGLGFAFRNANHRTGSPVIPPPQSPIGTPQSTPSSTPTYHTLTLTTSTPLDELTKVIGYQNLPLVLRINRTNSGYIRKGATLTIPDIFVDQNQYSPFPDTIPEAQSIQKLIIISQRVQAFALYESGTQIRWGPTSTGKKSTPTQNGLFATNWKGKEVVSSFDDEWLLKWNFNIINFAGIGMHQYTMPGYPASHSCVRMFGSDAEYIYNWADEWVLAQDGKTRLAYGTPVILFGDYAYDKKAPWEELANDPQSTTLSSEELETVLHEYIDTIQERAKERKAVLNTSV